MLTRPKISFWRLCFGRGSVVCPPSNGEVFRGIQYSMSMVIDTRFRIDSVRPFITKYDIYYYTMRQLFYYKMRLEFITKWVSFFITKCDSFITKFDSCYKMRRLLQIGTVHSSRYFLEQLEIIICKKRKYHELAV